MEIFLKFLPSIVGVIIASTPYVYRRFFARPELTIELKNIRSSSSQVGVSAKNEPTPEGYFDGNNAIYVYNQQVKFVTVVRNSSPHTAYYPKLYLSSDNTSFGLEKLDSYKPLLSGEFVELKGTLTMYHESRGIDRLSKEKEVENLNDLVILLEYRNALRTKVYTLYTKSFDDKNAFLFRKPRRFKS
jgi:hypothetical protein